MLPQNRAQTALQLQDWGWLVTLLGRYMRLWFVFRVFTLLVISSESSLLQL
jgi:hypothetical protein